MREEFGVDSSVGVKLNNLFQSYAVLNITDRSPKKVHRRIAKALSQHKDVLAVEFLQQERVFGMAASLEEMQKFKSRVKR